MNVYDDDSNNGDLTPYKNMIGQIVGLYEATMQWESTTLDNQVSHHICIKNNFIMRIIGTVIL